MHTATAVKTADVITPNFETVTAAFFSGRNPSSLTDLVTAFAAAEQEVAAAAEAEEAFPYDARTPCVEGGTNPAIQIVTDGKSLEIPAAKWFYRSREEIQRSYDGCVAEATAEQLKEIEQRFSGYRVEYEMQEKALARQIPRGKRAAERRLAKAHRALTAIEEKIINFSPTNLEDAAALLEYVGESRRTCFTADEHDLLQIMRNVAEAVRAKCGAR
ncbi:hypothetical protein [Rhodopseudomonas sp. RCAM05734]|uniref:hypothetical protein n=1 Tax=Rhodopseudomonas sp. RCAM05734 TaxID=3457549 RepID=UPI004043F55E